MMVTEWNGPARTFAESRTGQVLTVKARTRRRLALGGRFETLLFAAAPLTAVTLFAVVKCFHFSYMCLLHREPRIKE
jgi:hypothetical protein